MEIPKEFDVEIYRSRLTLSLYRYGIRKLHGEIVSESEQTGKIRRKRKLKKSDMLGVICLVLFIFFSL